MHEALKKAGVRITRIREMDKDSARFIVSTVRGWVLLRITPAGFIRVSRHTAGQYPFAQGGS